MGLDAVEERVNELECRTEENTQNKTWRGKMIENKYRTLKDM